MLRRQYSLALLHVVVADGHGLAGVVVRLGQHAAADDVDVALQDVPDAQAVLGLHAVLFITRKKAKYEFKLISDVYPDKKYCQGNYLITSCSRAVPPTAQLLLTVA